MHLGTGVRGENETFSPLTPVPKGTLINGTDILAGEAEAAAEVTGSAETEIVISEIGAESAVELESVETEIKLSGQWKIVNENMSDFSRMYQKQITGKENVVWVQNGVKFDGMKDGVLLDAKGKYAQFINPNTGEFYDWFSGKQSLVDEAIRQINASEGAKIKWYFAEEETLNVVYDLFMEQGITEIELIFEAPK